MRFRSLLVFLTFTLSLVVVGGSVAQESSGPTDTATLKAVVGNRFTIGVGVSERILSDPNCSELIREQFQILTPENCMKPQGIHPAEDRWNFLPGYSNDGLHLERPAYEVWASALRPIFQKLLGPRAATDEAPGPTGVPSKTDP